MIRNLLAAVVGGTVDYLQGLLAEIDRLTAERDEARAKAAEHWADLEILRDATWGSGVLEMPAGRRWAGDDLPAGLVEAPWCLREGSETGDPLVMWSPAGIVTLVLGERSDAELHALLDAALARLRAGEPPAQPATIEPGESTPW